MERDIRQAAGVTKPMELPSTPIGFGRWFAAFSQEILDRYAIWENYPWNNAVLQFLEHTEQEEVPEKQEPSSFFVTVELLKLYVEQAREAEKKRRSSAEKAEQTEERESEKSPEKNSKKDSGKNPEENTGRNHEAGNRRNSERSTEKKLEENARKNAEENAEKKLEANTRRNAEENTEKKLEGSTRRNSEGSTEKNSAENIGESPMENPRETLEINSRQTVRGEEEDSSALLFRLEAELKLLKARSDRSYGILERLSREGAEMPQEELEQIWSGIERERERRLARTDRLRKERGLWLNPVGMSGAGITPHALGRPWIRLRQLTEKHGYMPDGKELFRLSVQRQQQEFYTELVRTYLVQETERQAQEGLGRQLHPLEQQALMEYGDSLSRTELAFYAQNPGARLYEETAALVLSQLAATPAETPESEHAGSEKSLSPAADRQPVQETEESKTRSWEMLRRALDQMEQGGLNQTREEMRDPAAQQMSRTEEIPYLLSILPDTVSREAAQEVLRAEVDWNQGPLSPLASGIRLVYRVEESISSQNSEEVQRQRIEKKEERTEPTWGRQMERPHLSGIGSHFDIEEKAVFLRRISPAFQEERQTVSAETASREGEAKSREKQTGFSEPADHEREVQSREKQTGFSEPANHEREAKNWEKQTGFPETIGIQELVRHLGVFQKVKPSDSYESAVQVFRQEPAPHLFSVQRPGTQESETQAPGIQTKWTAADGNQGPLSPLANGDRLVYRREESGISQNPEKVLQPGMKQKEEHHPVSPASADREREAGSREKKTSFPETLEIQPLEIRQQDRNPEITHPKETPGSYETAANGSQGPLSPLASGVRLVYRREESGVGQNPEKVLQPGVRQKEEGSKLVSGGPENRLFRPEIAQRLNIEEKGVFLRRSSPVSQEEHRLISAAAADREREDGNHEKKTGFPETLEMQRQEPLSPLANGDRLVYRREESAAGQNTEKVLQPGVKQKEEGSESGSGGSAARRLLTEISQRFNTEERKDAPRRSSPVFREGQHPVLAAPADHEDEVGSHEKKTVFPELLKIQRSGPLSPLASGVRLVYRREESIISQNPESMLQPGRKKKEKRGESVSGMRENQPLLSEVWQHSSIEEKRILLRRIPQGLERVIQRAGMAEHSEKAEHGAGLERLLRQLRTAADSLSSPEGQRVLEKQSRRTQSRERLKQISQELEETAKACRETPDGPEQTARFQKLQRTVQAFRTETEMLSSLENQGQLFAREEQNLLYGMPRILENAAREYREAEKETERSVKYENLQKVIRELHIEVENQVRADRTRQWRENGAGGTKAAKNISKEREDVPAGVRMEAAERLAPEIRIRPAEEFRSLGSENAFPVSYADLETAGIVYASKAPEGAGSPQKKNDSQAVRDLETRVTRQEYIIRQDRIEMDELQQRLKKQENQTSALKEKERIRITSRQGSQLPQKLAEQLKEQLRLDRIRYGAD